MEHTQGPLKVAGQGNKLGELLIRRADGKEIACIRGEGRLGDAYLFAAAPDLLAMLIEAVEWWTIYTDSQGDDFTNGENEPERDTLLQAIATIAKAEGK